MPMNDEKEFINSHVFYDWHSNKWMVCYKQERKIFKRRGQAISYAAKIWRDIQQTV